MSYPDPSDVRAGVVYGATDELTGSLDLPVIADVRWSVTFDNGSAIGSLDLPDPSDVRAGTGFDADTQIGVLDLPVQSDVRNTIMYGSNKTEFTGICAVPDPIDVRINAHVDSDGTNPNTIVGSLDLPSASDVRDGITYDRTSLLGTLVSPDVLNVLRGISYGSGSEFTGTLDVPVVGDVREGVVFGSATGTLGIPLQSDVRNTIMYGTADTEFTGTLDLPAPSDVRVGVTFDATTKTGVLDLPVVADVRLNVLYDNATAQGTLDLPGIADVRLNVSYGANSVEFVGTMTDNIDQVYTLVTQVNDVTNSIYTNTVNIGNRIPSTLDSGMMRSITEDIANTPLSKIWNYLTTSITTVGGVGKFIIDNLTGIKSKTDQLAFTVSNKVDATVNGFNGKVQIQGDINTLDELASEFSDDWELGGGGSGQPVGPGAISQEFEILTNQNVPIAEAKVWVTTDEVGTHVIAGTLHTDVFGKVVFMLDVGTYYLWRASSRYKFSNPSRFTVS